MSNKYCCLSDLSDLRFVVATLREEVLIENVDTLGGGIELLLLLTFIITH
jgi:hypothetical protein